MSSRLNNYLRAYRKRSGFSEQEVAFLLGSADGGKVSRYEQGHRLPPLRTALAFSIIFGVPLAVLFGGIQGQVKKNVAPRIELLRSKLEHKRDLGRRLALLSRKSRRLDEHHGRARNGSEEPSP